MRRTRRWEEGDVVADHGQEVGVGVTKMVNGKTELVNWPLSQSAVGPHDRVCLHYYHVPAAVFARGGYAFH